MVSSRSQLGISAAFVVLNPGLSLGHYSWRRGWTRTFKSQSFDHLSHVARVCFYPKALENSIAPFCASPIICVLI